MKNSHTLSVTANATDGGTLSYQWYSNTSASNIGGTAISRATSTTYKPPTGTVGTYYYFVEVKNTTSNNGDGGTKTATVRSNAVTLTVNTLVNAQTPNITSQPVGATVAANASHTMSVVASVTDGGTLSYQWYSNTGASNSGGTSLGTGAKSASYSPSTATAGTFYYYVVVTNTITDNGDGGNKTATTSSDAVTIVISTPTYTVTFNPNGGNWSGSTANKTETVTGGTAVAKPTDPGKARCTFNNWYTQKTGGAQFNFETLITENITLYARWTYILPLTDVTDVVPYLETQTTGSTAGNPAPLPMKIDLGTMTQATSGWQQLLTALDTAGKFVDLDLTVCTMTGTEFNPDYNIETSKDKIVSITLPTTATSIAGGQANTQAFRNFTALKSFSGTGLTSIGQYAFYDCTNLALTELPTGITSIGNSAFFDCTNLALTELPTGIISISGSTFLGCENLALTSLPAGITSIGNYAFGQCSSLALTSLPAGITSIDDNVFSGCTNLTLTSLPAGITSIGSRAFSVCTSLAQIELSMGITSIGDNAFGSCRNLSQVTCLATTPPELGTNVFSNTNSTLRIEVPAGSVDAYKAATNWSTYADKIFEITPSP